MIYEFGFKNFFSFREGGTISFKLDANCPAQISRGLDYSTVLSIKGANASGKTSVLRALSFIMHFASRSFQLEPESRTHLESFFKNSDPSDFYLEFSINNLIYKYELSLTDNEVLHESLARKKSRDVLLFERKKQKITSRTNEFAHLDKLILRKNSSVISLANQYGIDAINKVFDFFNTYATNVSYNGLREQPLSISFTSKFLKENSKAFTFVKSFIKDIDSGVDDISIKESKNDKGETTYFPLFTHRHENKSISILPNIESSGTKALFRNLASHWLTLNYGTINIVDEIDANLHPMILAKIVELYIDKNTNKKNAQLIFTTHNTEVLDILGRYRTYLVNKENNSSYVYRLDEIPGDILRNDRPISTPYLNGKIGGIPKL